MNTSNRATALLQRETADLARWLGGFYSGESGRTRRAWLGKGNEFVVVEALPLPDRYQPDEIDALLLLDNFPSVPPIGLYVLNKGNEGVVQQLRSKFHAFQNAAAHDARSIPGYTWICYHYAENTWRYNASAPNRGDNLTKFVASFFAELQA